MATTMWDVTKAWADYRACATARIEDKEKFYHPLGTAFHRYAGTLVDYKWPKCNSESRWRDFVQKVTEFKTTTAYKDGIKKYPWTAIRHTDFKYSDVSPNVLFDRQKEAYQAGQLQVQQQQEQAQQQTGQTYQYPQYPFLPSSQSDPLPAPPPPSDATLTIEEEPQGSVVPYVVGGVVLLGLIGGGIWYMRSRAEDEE